MQTLLLSLLLFLVPPHGSAALATASTEEDSSRWLLSFNGFESNSLAKDPRFTSLLDRELPHYPFEWLETNPLPELAFRTLSELGDKVSVDSHRYVTVTGSVFQVATNKGFLWVDTSGESSPHLVYAYMDMDRPNEARVSLFVKQPKPLISLLPPLASSLAAWCRLAGVQHVSSFTSYDQNKQHVDLSTDLLNSR